MPFVRAPIAHSPGSPPRLLVLIDVEEEFDWGEPFDRGARAATNLARLPDFIDRAGSRGLVPVGVCSHPCVDDERPAAILRELVQSGRMIAGAHLHPWVCPPYDDDDLRPGQSFPGNLPPAREAAKLDRLTARIEEALGTRPLVYQAGRYGLGPHTADVLEELGFEVDMSLCPPYDYRPEGGPDFSRADARPFWFGQRRALLGLPVTGAFLGWARPAGPLLFRVASGPALGRLHAPGLLARLGALERVRLSPEGHELGDMQRLVRALLTRGVGVFTFTLHSPTLVPGCTPYVRSESQAREFVGRCEAFFDWFLGELGGRPATPLALRDELLQRQPPPWHATRTRAATPAASSPRPRDPSRP